MKANPYLNFGGTCAEAFRFYAEVLGGTLQIMTHGETPAAGRVSPDWHDKVLHACLVAGDVVLMGSDAPPEHHAPAQGLYVALHVQDPAEAERIFHALAEDGTVQMPIAATFWSERFGMLLDRFGTPWMVNCDPAGA